MIRVTVMTIALGLVGCQTTKSADLNLKDDYRKTRENLQKGRYREALRSFPEKERGEFVTTMEKGWLRTLAGKPNTDPLVEVSKDLESRKTVYVTKEARKFFLKEVADGYLPAEHEVILFHVLTGLAFAQKGEITRARVEAQRASRYLQGHYGDHAGNFDDPALRMLLAALWLYCGDWQHARVDMRVAARLSSAYAWLGKLAERPAPPRNFVLVLRGLGPEPIWRSDSDKRWGLEFVDSTPKDAVTVQSDAGRIELVRSLAVNSWYDRHTQRDSPARTMLDDVRHSVDVVFGAVGASLVGLGAAVAATVIAAAGVAVLVAVVVVAANSGGGNLVDPAFRLAASLTDTAVTYAASLGQDGATAAAEVYDDASDESDSYRFVRFLPSRYYATAPKDFHGQTKLTTGQRPILDVDNGMTRVVIFHLP